MQRITSESEFERKSGINPFIYSAPEETENSRRRRVEVGKVARAPAYFGNKEDPLEVPIFRGFSGTGIFVSRRQRIHPFDLQKPPETRHI